MGNIHMYTVTRGATPPNHVFLVILLLLLLLLLLLDLLVRRRRVVPLLGNVGGLGLGLREGVGNGLVFCHAGRRLGEALLQGLVVLLDGDAGGLGALVIVDQLAAVDLGVLSEALLHAPDHSC